MLNLMYNMSLGKWDTSLALHASQITKKVPTDKTDAVGAHVVDRITYALVEGK